MAILEHIWYNNWRQPLMEDDIWWKRTFDGRWPLMKDNLRWKKTYDRRRSLIWDELKFCSDQNFFQTKNFFLTKYFFATIFFSAQNFSDQTVFLETKRLIKTIPKWPNQPISAKSNLSNQTYQAKYTKPNHQNQVYQTTSTKLILPN